jgi:hypothetical protein
MPKKLRALVLVLALVAMLGVSAASTTPAHFHLNSSPNRCDLCFTAHVSAMESPAVQPVHGLEVNGPAALLLPYFGYRPFSSQPSCSRGPPSLCL